MRPLAQPLRDPLLCNTAARMAAVQRAAGNRATGPCPLRNAVWRPALALAPQDRSRPGRRSFRLRVSTGNEHARLRRRPAVGGPGKHVSDRGWRPALARIEHHLARVARGVLGLGRLSKDVVSPRTRQRNKVRHRADAFGRRQANVAPRAVLASALAGAGPRPELDDVPVRIGDVRGARAVLLEVLLVRIEPRVP